MAKRKHSAAKSSRAAGKSTAGSKGEIKLESLETEAASLDPHLQQVIAGKSSGPLVDPDVMTESGDGVPAVDVLAKLKDPSVPVAGLTVVDANGQIITGTVEVARIEEVRAHPNVLMLKRATRLHQDLRYSVPEIRADAASLQHAGSATGIDGRGVIVGVVDYGCDFLHRNFRKSDGSTRLLWIWDQNGGATSTSPQPYGYGREYTAAQINAALGQASAPPASNDPIYTTIKFPEDPNNRAYTMLGYGPEATPINARGAGNHGTHVMDIAAGNGRGSGFPGVAPGADLIFVEVSTNDFGVEESFGNSRRLVEAVRYIFRKAKELGRPCVINLSLGTHGGPHDGSTLVEQDFDQLLMDPGRAIVISAGNSWERHSHASGKITVDAPRTLSWQMGLQGASGQFGDPTANELEVWYPDSGELSVTLVSPGGQAIGPTALGRRREIKVGNNVLGLIVHRKRDSGNGDNHIDIILSPALPLGEWKVQLSATGGSVDFHAWIERDDRGQSRFAPADDVRTHTLGSVSCGANTFVVGSYDARATDKDLSRFTSEGPTRDGKQKPEFSAPGHAIQAAWSLTHDKMTSMSGTSMAAPHVAGLAALVMQAAGAPLAITDLRRLVTSAARAMGNGWHTRYGAGRVDAVGAVDSARGAGPIETAVLVRSHGVATMETNNGHPGRILSPIDELLVSLAQAATDRRARIRLQLDIEPFGT